MPIFPAQQARILALAEAMIAGYTDHAALFPSSDAAVLASLRDVYNTAANNQTEALAAAQLATEAKQAALVQLQREMRKQLKTSQVDSCDNPENLNFIGWGPRRAAQVLKVPGQPVELKSIEEGAGILTIAWKRPARGKGGKVRTYIIERRELSKDGSGPWRQAGISLEKKSTLKDQPRGVQLEYRVKAVNRAGESGPSNTVPVVL